MGLGPPSIPVLGKYVVKAAAAKRVMRTPVSALCQIAALAIVFVLAVLDILDLLRRPAGGVSVEQNFRKTEIGAMIHP